MLHRVRLAMQSEQGGKLGGGGVEIDGTFIGGRARNMHWDRKQRALKGKTAGAVGKVAVHGLLARHGKDGHSVVRTVVVNDVSRDGLEPSIRANVRKGVTVYTDEARSYRFLNSDYIHKVIDHAERYVDGQVHTNTLDNFWSCLKRGLKGTYISVEPFHLFRYLDEQSFRFNNRKDTDAERFAEVLDGIVGKRVDYATLTARTP
jgi:transposase-like protein